MRKYFYKINKRKYNFNNVLNIKNINELIEKSIVKNILCINVTSKN